MTIDATTTTSAPPPSPGDCAPQEAPQPTLGALVNRLARQIEEELSRGDRASIRKVSPSEPAPAGFWRLWVRSFEGRTQGMSPQAEAEEIRRWRAILVAMTWRCGRHRAQSRGAAMAVRGISELRVLKLLNANDEQLHEQVRMVAKHLLSRAVECNQGDIARLILSDGRDGSVAVRDRIARDYYSRLHTESKR